MKLIAFLAAVLALTGGIHAEDYYGQGQYGGATPYVPPPRYGYGIDTPYQESQGSYAPSDNQGMPDDNHQVGMNDGSRRYPNACCDRPYLPDGENFRR